MVVRCRTSQCILDVMKRYLPFIIIILVLVVAIGIFAVMFRGGTGGGNSSSGLSNSNQPAQVVDKGPAPAQSTSGSATIFTASAIVRGTQ